MKRYYLAPLWTLQLATGAKNFDRNAVLGSRRLNAGGLHRSRVAIAAKLARHRRRTLADAVPAAWLEQFEKNGFIEIRNVLPAEIFRQLREQIMRLEAPRRVMTQGNAITRRMAINSAMLNTAPLLRTFLDHPAIAAAMRYVATFDSQPLHYIQGILKSADGLEDPQTSLHADTFHSSMKSWLFLNDVREGSGALTYVPGSHRLTDARLRWEQERADIICTGGGDRLSRRGSFRIAEDELGKLELSQPVELAVPANTLVIADTFGFHARGRSEGANQRVEIWSYLRRNPFLPWAGGDILSTPALADRRVDMLWNFRDRFQGFMGQPWRPSGIGSILGA